MKDPQWIVRRSRSAAWLLFLLPTTACGLLAPTPPDATPGDDASGGYHDIGQLGYWSAFDVGTLGGLYGFAGAAFDGRYVYLVPDLSEGIVVRYDTRADFGDRASWTTFDTTRVDANARSFIGAAFDGRYVYLVPNVNGTNLGSFVTRYDTQSDFESPGSWSTFDTKTLDPYAEGFFGAAFDGRYVYLVPNSYTRVVRYDTRASFASASSWSTWDTAAAGARTSFAGAVSDGRYVYLVPGDAPVATRYDSQGAFADTASWTTFDTTTADPNARAFLGGAFDGRYVYYVPDREAFSGIVARFDTQQAFARNTGGWRTFDSTVVDARAKSFAGGAFDGRYVYFVPFSNNLFARCDTRAGFGDAAAWSILDATRIDPEAKGFVGAAFDGRYLYFAPNGHVVLRFEAREAGGPGAGGAGSFL